MRVALKVALMACVFSTLGGTAMAENLPDANRKVIASFTEAVFNKKDLSTVERYMDPDYIQHNHLVKPGASGFKEFFSAWFNAVPDWNYTPKKIAADGDEVWLFGTYAGTLEKDWLGIKATGQHYAVEAVDVFRIRNGKLAEHWDVVDVYGLFKQLGKIK